MTSPQQVSANRANAQHSTGPTSEAGKAKSALNAVKSGLTGRTVLLPNDDVAAYEALIATVTTRYSPVEPRELALAQSIADAEWRIERIALLEFGLYALGDSEFADAAADQPERFRAAVIRTKTYRAYEKQFRNLHLQEGRIRRHRENDLEELRELQAQREAKRQAEHEQQVIAATASLIKACEAGVADSWTPQANGFEFSFKEIYVKLAQIRPDLFDAHRQILRQKMAS